MAPKILPCSNWDVIIIGSGLAGLYTALQLSGPDFRVLLITKGAIGDSNTEQAQGGIAASISKQDSTYLHMEDTLVAGAGLCDPGAVKDLVEEGPGGISHLIELGVGFDQSRDGTISLTQEGAHSRRRILHARGDSTGKAIRETLTAQVSLQDNIVVAEHTFALELLMGPGGCMGVLCFDSKDDHINYLAPHVVIASGGACQMFKNNTNPPTATGDGIAMAWRAGAIVADLEFVQFHPTALMLRDSPHFLISEAVRGEGARLLNKNKEPFMAGYHPLADLAPRDIVSRAIVQEMHRSGSDFVWLDLSTVKAKEISARFPTIFRRCKDYGLNLPRDLIPVAPAAHYFIGGIVTDQAGTTNIPGLYACGESTCTGVHGANRLASNSLLEALVFGKRIAQHIRKSRRSSDDIYKDTEQYSRLSQLLRSELQELMWKNSGLERSKTGLSRALAKVEDWLADLQKNQASTPPSRTEQEDINMLILARLVVQAALLRKESRGGHFRTDYPRPLDSQRGHWLMQVGREPQFIEVQEV